MDDIILFELPSFSMNQNVKRNHTFTKGLQNIIEDLKDSRNFKQTRNVGDDDDQFCLRNLCCCCLQRPSIRN
jgi:hypothetical protein